MRLFRREHDDAGIGTGRRIRHQLDAQTVRSQRERCPPLEQHGRQFTGVMLRQQLERDALAGGGRHPLGHLLHGSGKPRGTIGAKLRRHDVLHAAGQPRWTMAVVHDAHA